MSLCTIEDIHLYKQTDYNPSDPTYLDNLYESLILSTSSLIERMTGRTFEATDHVIYVDGTGTQYLLTPNFPINSVTEISIGAINSTYTAIDLDEVYIDYVLGELYYTGGFVSGVKNVKLTYNAGYSDIPDDLSLLCVQVIVDTVSLSSKDGNVTREKLGDYEYQIKEMVNDPNQMYAGRINMWKRDC